MFKNIIKPAILSILTLLTLSQNSLSALFTELQIPPVANAAPKIIANSPSRNDLNKSSFDLNLISTDNMAKNPSILKSDNPLESLLNKVIEFATTIVASIGIILLILAGLMMITAGGDQQKIDKAKEIFTYTLSGLAIIFLSYTIVIFVQSIFY